MKKLMEGIKKVVTFIFFVIYFVFALCMTVLLLNYNDFGVTQFGDKSIIMVTSKISNDEYAKGDLVITQSKKIDQYKEGEYIFTYRVGSDRIPVLEVGKIGKVYPEEDAISFENGQTYTSEYIAGVAEAKYEKVGTALSIVESKWGFLFIILIPVFLIFIYEVYALIIEIKYGALED